MSNLNSAIHLVPSLWIEKNISLVHPETGLIPFTLHPFQKNLIDIIDSKRYVITNKFRQGGITALCVAYALWEAIHQHDQRIMFLTKTDGEAIDLNKRAKMMLDHLPSQPHFGKIPYGYNNHHINIIGGSEICFCTPQASCGKAITHLYIDEAAYIQNMEDHWKNIYPALYGGGKCTVVSTTNGTGNWFHEVFSNAMEKKNDFHAVHLSYRDHPEYTLEKEQEMLKNLGDRGFLQEMCGCFLVQEPKPKDDIRDRFNSVLEKMKTHIVAECKKEILREFNL